VAAALDGLKVVELSHEACAWAGKLLAELGADVVVVEPPGGSAQRTYGPWLDDSPGPERSLWWWHYNTSKRSVVLDLDGDEDRRRFVELVTRSDVLLEGEPPGVLASLGVDYPDLSAANPRLIHASVTPFGRSGPSRDLPATDLTVLAAGGPVWSCGYDDHSLPPVRGGGGQGYHTASHWAVQAVLVAMFERDESGAGQHIDVSMHAAANVTTEAATYAWHAARVEVRRQTGRHAGWGPSLPTQIRCADGRFVNTGLLPRTPKEFGLIVGWLDELGLREEFPLTVLLEMGAERETIEFAKMDSDPMLVEILAASREVTAFLCERLSAYEFFHGWQSRGLAGGIVYSPDEALDDPHVVARGFPVEVEHPELRRSFTYPGAPYRMSATPWQLRHRAPLLGEHQELVDE
jgi:crotonobetainyl-CoA:carnitine CoA-transferase CaiB-like acyl-CoA transferase